LKKRKKGFHGSIPQEDFNTTHTHTHTQFTIQIQSKVVDDGNFPMWVVDWCMRERWWWWSLSSYTTKLIIIIIIIIIIPSSTRLHRSCAALKVGQRDGSVVVGCPLA
jgi:hypothetical protein